jgi:hypothetical protein
LISAKEEIQNPKLVFELLFSIQQIRAEKLRHGIQALDGNYIQVYNFDSSQIILPKWKWNKSGLFSPKRSITFVICLNKQMNSHYAEIVEP